MSGNMPEWYREMRSKMDAETLQLNNSFNKLVEQMAEELSNHPDGPGVLYVIAMMGPRAFIEDHIACVVCSERVREVKSPEQTNNLDLSTIKGTDESGCLAVALIKGICDFADEVGHPEWIDGEKNMNDPLEDPDLPMAG